MRRSRGAFVIGLALLTQATAALALGFGRIGHSTSLGQQLDFSVVLTTDGSELPSLPCVTAEVLVGDNPLPSTQVRSRLEVPADGGPAVLHVVTSVRIDEPVASINVAVGCPPRLSRKFVVFIDPPLLVPPTVASTGAAGLPAAGGASSSGPLAPASSVVATPLARGGSASGAIDEAGARAVPRRAVADAQPRDRPAPPRAQADRPAGGSVRSIAAVQPPHRVPLAAARQNGTAGPSARASSAAAPRLKLEADPQPYQSLRVAAPGAESPPAAAVAAASAAVAPPAAAALSDEQQRIRQLEQSLQKVLADARTTQASLAELQTRLREAESARFFNPWVYGLLALVAALLAAVALLLWRQARLKREAAWWAGGTEADATVAVVTPADPEPGPELPPTVPADDPAAPPLLPAVAAPPAPSGEPPQRFVVAGLPEIEPAPAPFDPLTTSVGAALRDMTVEELIDLEQQAEFFTVLGQDDAAIELLMGHVRHGGSTSPLAFLKLLEIFRRRDERAPYERVCERFNRRFNAYAPDWDAAGAGSGRHLDSYPKVSAAIEAAWPEPRQAMVLLDSLLFHRDARAGTFDLPAYGELLFLYSQARDLAEHAVPTDTVDLLLPIGEEAWSLSATGEPLAAAEVPTATAWAPQLALPPEPLPAVPETALGLTLNLQPLPMPMPLQALPPSPSPPVPTPAPPKPSAAAEQPVSIDFDLDEFDASAPATRR